MRETAMILISAGLGGYLWWHFRVRGVWRSLAVGAAAGLFVWSIKVITIWYGYHAR